MSLDTVMNALADVESQIDGVKRSYPYMPPSINEFPCFVNVGKEGDVARLPSMRSVTHHATMYLYVTQGASLDETESILRPFLDLTFDMLDTNLTLNGACANSAIKHYSFGVLSYNSKTYLGIIFNLDIVEWIPFTFSA